MILSGHNKRKLKAAAHNLKPVVYLGKQGVTDSFIKSVNQSLNDHELIKIRFIDFKDERKDLISLITERTESGLVGIVGNTAIIYRQSENPEKQHIILD